MDKQRQIEKQMIEQNGENNRLQQMKELEEGKRKLHEEQMKNIQGKQEIDANKLAAELKSIQYEIQILATKNKTIFEYMTFEEFINLFD